MIEVLDLRKGGLYISSGSGRESSIVDGEELLRLVGGVYWFDRGNNSGV